MLITIINGIFCPFEVHNHPWACNRFSPPRLRLGILIGCLANQNIAIHNIHSQRRLAFAIIFSTAILIFSDWLLWLVTEKKRESALMAT